MFKLQECLRNKIKQARRKLQKQGDDGDEGTSRKRRRKSGNDQCSGGILFNGVNDSQDDPHSVEDHCKVMPEDTKEKASSRDAALFPLLKSAYSSR